MDEQHINGYWQRSAPDIKKNPNLYWLTSLMFYKLGVISRTISYSGILWINAVFPRLIKYVRWYTCNPASTIRVLGSQSRKEYIPMCQTVQENLIDLFMSLLCFHLLLTLNTQTRTSGSGSDWSQFFNIFKILTSKIKKIKLNNSNTLNKRHRRPNVLCIYFHTHCFDIMIQCTYSNEIL